MVVQTANAHLDKLKRDNQHCSFEVDMEQPTHMAGLDSIHIAISVLTTTQTHADCNNPYGRAESGEHLTGRRG